MPYNVVYKTLIDSTCVVTVILNLIILPIVLKHNKWMQGSFKLLMMVFAGTNVMHNILDVIFLPRVIHLSGLAIAYADGLLGHPSNWLGPAIISFLFSVFCIQIFNESIHFLYRYILLCRKVHHYLLETRVLSGFLLVSILILGTYTFIVMIFHGFPEEPLIFEIEEEIRRTYNISAAQMGGVLFRYWIVTGDNWSLNPAGMALLCLFMTPCLVFFGSMLHSGYQTKNAMDKLSASLSSSTKKQNQVLFRMLVVQAVVPFFLLHLPAIILFVGPLICTLKKELLDVFIVILLSCPALEPLIAIYFLSKGKFRQIFWSLFGRKLKIFTTDTAHNTALASAGP